MASTVIVITFDNVEKAGSVLDSIRTLENENVVVLKDAAIVVKNSEGKVAIKETRDVTTRRGAVTGGTLGLIIGIIIGGPVGGLVVGGLLGAWTAKKIDLGISNEKIKSIADGMTEESSALFLQLVRSEKEDWLAAVVRDSGGKIVEFELSDDAEIAVDEHLTDYTARH